MNGTRRALALTGLALTLTGALPGLAQADDKAWPNKPIQLLIPYPPGGSTDLIARPLSVKLQEKLGQPVLLEYKPGAGGTVASQALARSKPDGYTFIMVLAAHAISVELAKITTLGERVEDVFLLRGEQLQDARTRVAIEQELLQALAPGG